MLVKSYSRKDVEDRPDLIESMPDAKITYNGIMTVLRPGAHAFLEDVNKIGDVYLFTAAQLSYAKSIVKAFSLGRYFKKYYSTVYHTHNSISHELNLNGTAWVLVEDSPPTLEISQYKLSSLGLTSEQIKTQSVIEKHYIEVRPYLPHLVNFGGGLEEMAVVIESRIKYLEKRLILY